MTAVRPLPRTGSIFFDARGDERALRVSWHEDADLVVVSLWRDNVCTGSFRLAADDSRCPVPDEPRIRFSLPDRARVVERRRRLND